MDQQFYIFTDYVSYNGGVNNLQRSRICPVGQVWGAIKIFTSTIDKAEARAKAYAKKHKLQTV